VAISAGGYHSLALKADGSIVGWGLNDANQATPPPGNDFVAVSAGLEHSLALKADGSIVAWGLIRLAVPPDGNDFVAISAGEEFSLALRQVAPPPIEAVVKIRPNTLNLRSKGKWLTCHIWLPEGYDVTDVNSYSVFLEDEIEADWIWFDEEQRVVMAKFSRQALQQLLVDLETPTTVELLISGQLNDATPFEGTDTIRVINKGRMRRRRVNSNSKVVDGIEYYIQTDKAVYNLGENVKMLYRVTNLGDQEVNMWFPHSPVYNFWVAKDQEHIWRAVNAWWDVTTTLVLAPGESKEFPDYEPPQIWDMSDTDGNSVSPGRYTVIGGLYAGSGLWDFTRVSVGIRIISDRIVHKEVSMDSDTIRPIDKPRKNPPHSTILKRKR
jgi:hypothetical protein